MSSEDLGAELVDRAETVRKARAVIREMIRHEDNLRNDRVNWLLALNAFLFAALAFAWDAKESKLLVCVLAAVGVSVGLTTVAAMSVSNAAIKNLRDWADAHTPSDPQVEPPIVGLRSDELPITGRRWFQAWNVFPYLLATAWVAVIVIRVFIV